MIRRGWECHREQGFRIYPLGYDVLDDLPVDVREAEMPSLKFKGELLMVNSEQMQDRGLEVVDVDFVVNGIKADIIGSSVGDAGFNASSSHPSGKGVGVMVTTPAFAVLHVALEKRSTTEFAAPDDEGFIEHAALLEIADETCAGLVGILALGVEFRGEGAVLVPARVHELDELSSAFGETTGEQTIAGEGARLMDPWSVEIEDLLGLIGDVGEFGDTGLHTIGHFILRDTGGDFRITVILVLHLVEAANIVEELAAHGLTHPIRIRKVEDRVAGGSKLNTLVARRKEPGSPVEVIENLSAGGSLADRGHYHDRWKIVVHGSQAIAEPGAHGRSAG